MVKSVWYRVQCVCIICCGTKVSGMYDVAVAFYAAFRHAMERRGARSLRTVFDTMQPTPTQMTPQLFLFGVFVARPVMQSAQL